LGYPKEAIFVGNLVKSTIYGYDISKLILADDLLEIVKPLAQYRINRAFLNG